MSLPKCVKVDSRGRQPEGLRHVGTLLTFEGIVPHEPSKRVMLATPACVACLAQLIRFSGRLWRDPEVPKADAIGETQRYIREFRGSVYMLGPGAFLLFDDPRVCLIGVHEEVRGKGHAKTLIRHASQGWVVAGTYDDNSEAIGLYLSLGMGAIKAEEVYHE